MPMSSAVAFSSFTSLSLRSFRFSSSSFFPNPSFLTQTLTLKPSSLHLPDMNLPLPASFYCDGTPSPLDDIDEDELEALFATISSDKMPPETEEEITAAYEKRYGPAYSGVSVLGNDVFVMDAKLKKNVTSLGRRINVKVDDGFEERVVEVRRVSKVVKGGKRMSFRVVVAVGNKAGMVGVGVGKAKEVVDAIAKSAANARKNVVTVPLTKYMTFPHRSDGDYGAAKVMLRPACPGTGVRAGGAVRHVLEMAGVKDALGKQLGSDNPLNNARATLMAVMKMRTFREVALERGIPMEELWK